MSKINELSAFQKNMNYLTFYLYLMNTKSKYLTDYDDEGDFETHNYFFNKCRNIFNDKIQDDKYLLLNDPNNRFFIDFFTTLEHKNGNKTIKYEKLTQKEKQFIYEKYFEYSKTLSKSKFRNKAKSYCSWSFLVIIISLLIGFFLYLLNLSGKCSLKELSYPYFIIFLMLTVSGFYFVYGKILSFEIRNKKITKKRFNYLYSDDYCYKRIKECEFFFRMNYKIENEFLELSEIERQFPEFDNLFYNTIQTIKMSETNKQKLLKINEHVYCRAVFSELFKSIKEDGIEQLQQIPFVFKTCKQKANVIIPGNTGFVECINDLLETAEYTDTTFNQALSKLSNPENDIIPKYLKILKKYENILQ